MTKARPPQKRRMLRGTKLLVAGGIAVAGLIGCAEQEDDGSVGDLVAPAGATEEAPPEEDTQAAPAPDDTSAVAAPAPTSAGTRGSTEPDGEEPSPLEPSQALDPEEEELQ